MKILPVLFQAFLYTAFLGCTSRISIIPSDTESTMPPENAKFVSMVWRPNMIKNDLDIEPLAIYKKVTFSIASVSDSRQQTTLIGKTLEDKKIQNAFIPLATKSSVKEWCSTGLVKIMNDLDIKIDNKRGNVSLEIEIVDFSIEDNITQTGNISLKITANTSDDLLVWEGKIDGTSKLYYRPNASDGISECLSNTLLVTIHNFLTEHSFRDAMMKAFELS